MTLLQELEIKDESSIIYAKTTLKNILKREKRYVDESFLILSLMELSTNLLKHVDGGKIWLLESDSDMLIAALDYGGGIENRAWALQNGTTRMKNSLGIGLYQMNHHDYYHIEISSFTTKNIHGTIVLLKPRKFFKEVLGLQNFYIGERVCGDIIAKKGRFLLLADGSGHGRASNKSVELVKSYFYEHPFSCLLVDEFFTKVHETLKAKESRGVVLSIFEILKSQIHVCGIGNIAFWVQKSDTYENITQKEGIIGEAFSKSGSIEFPFENRIIAATDGISIEKMNRVLSLLQRELSAAMIALNAMHFASVMYDDKSIVVISKKRENREYE